MSYIDGFVIPLAKDKLDEYRSMAEQACKVWIEHGALDYKEAVVDHDNIEGVRSFAATSGAKDGEVTIFAYITYRSREHRDEVNEKVMSDPRIKEHCGQNVPFDCARMSYGGFKTIVES